ncbi:MAG: ribosome silencing factor [Pseudomonadota bacterium]
MQSELGAAADAAPVTEQASAEPDSSVIRDHILAWLEDAKAEDTVVIDLEGRSPVGDFMVITSGRSQRHVGAIADQVQKKLKEFGFGNARIEGQDNCDWVLVDIGDIVVHVFRPEVRDFYNLEKLWSADRPTDTDEQHH